MKPFPYMSKASLTAVVTVTKLQVEVTTFVDWSVNEF